jgi:hypothetical protein
MASEKKSPFDFSNWIFNKTHEPSEEEMKDYNPFMVNRALSNFPDTIWFAQEMNSAYNLPKDMQWSFLWHGIEKKKRWSKWPKRDTDEDDKINLIKEYYGYSTFRARETIPVIDSLNLWDKMKEELEKGGARKRRHL